MISVSTQVTRRAAAPAAWSDRARTSEGRKPRSGPGNWTAWRSYFAMTAGVTLDLDWELGWWKTHPIGVLGYAGFARRCVIQRIRARTGHTAWSPLQERPMTSPRTSFFWSSRISGGAKITTLAKDCTLTNIKSMG